MLHVYRSNRVEQLARELAALLRSEPLPDPLTPERVAVPGRGMERWLAHALAQELGATANIDFPFPGLAIEAVLASLPDLAARTGTATSGAAAPESGETSGAWRPERLAWAVLAALPGRLQEPEFAPLSSYLAGSPPSVVAALVGKPVRELAAAATVDRHIVDRHTVDRHTVDRHTVDRRLVLLARRIAEVFDRYAAWRPELVAAWDRQQDAEFPLTDADRWQPILWRDVRARVADEPLYLRVRRLEERLGRGPVARGPETPERLTLFAISALPALHLRAIRALSEIVDIHLLVLAPSQELWSHIRSRRDIARSLCRAGRVASAEDLLLEEGNPLLASLGRLGRDFQLLLESELSAGPEVFEHEPSFVDPAPDPDNDASLLAILQSDILHLRHRGRRGPDGLVAWPPVVLASDDASLRLHACHGPTRQVEVLRDELLALLDADPTLQPRDIVVMTPDVETYAPLVEAVFAGGHSGEPDASGERFGDHGFPRLPIAIADQTVRRENPVAEALLRALELVRSRATASEVLDLLGLEPVRRRFGLDAEGLAGLQEQVTAAGVRWGFDAAHRARHAQPADGQNTWRFGLDRLLLGIAMADEDGQLFAGVLPYDGQEGAAVPPVGRLAAFVDTLQDLAERFHAPRTMAQWRDDLTEALERLTATTARAAWLTRQVVDALDALAGDAGGVGGGAAAGLAVDALLDAQAVQTLLDGRFSVARASKGLMTGAVTFCALVPMRSIPFRVVCLLGLEEDAFPRRGVASSFDLVAARPRVGDRDGREDDRYLFLEALLAARDCVRIFFTGRDPQRNQSRPPAVPVAELLEVAQASAMPAPGGQALQTRLVREHALQPFSPRGFGLHGTVPHSYDRRMARAAARLLGARLAEAPPLFAAPLPTPARAPGTAGLETTVPLADLLRFHDLPVRFLLERRLGIRLGRAAGTLDDREPVELDSLQTWAVGNDLLSRAVAGQAREIIRGAVRASGRLPPGALGEALLDELEAGAADIHARLARRQVGAARSVALDCRLDVPGHGAVRLVGTVDRVWPGGLVDHRYGSLRAKHKIATWIRHLALQLAEPEAEQQSVFIARASDRDPGEFALQPLGADPLQRRQAAEAALAELVRLLLEGRSVPLALFPATSCAYVTAWQNPKRTDDTARWRAACSAAALAWRRFPQGGEHEEDPATALVFAGVDPYEPAAALPCGAEARGLDFHTLALRVWGPLLAAC